MQVGEQALSEARDGASESEVQADINPISRIQADWSCLRPCVRDLTDLQIIARSLLQKHCRRAYASQHMLTARLSSCCVRLRKLPGHIFRSLSCPRAAPVPEHLGFRSTTARGFTLWSRKALPRKFCSSTATASRRSLVFLGSPEVSFRLSQSEQTLKGNCSICCLSVASAVDAGCRSLL